MKVKDLIKLLAECDMESEVKVCFFDEDALGNFEREGDYDIGNELMSDAIGKNCVYIEILK